MGLTSTFTPILLIGCMIVTALLVTCEISTEHPSQPFQPRRSATARKLLYFLHYDEDAENEWRRVTRFPNHFVFNDEVDVNVRFSCRDLLYTAHTRIYNLYADLTVEDIFVRDIATGHRVVSAVEEDREEGKQRAFAAMVEYLQSLGVIQVKTCPVPQFSFPLRVTNKKTCPTGFNISCDSKCSFACGNVPENLLVGESTIVCQDDGTFNKPFPTCKAIKCQVPLYPDHVFSTCKSGALVDLNTTCAFACDPGYSITGRSTITCNTDGVFSGYTPHCKESTCEIPSFQSPLRSDCIPTSTLRVNTTCAFTCDRGFTLIGRSTLTCLADDTFSDSLPVCQRIGAATRQMDVSVLQKDRTGQSDKAASSDTSNSNKDTITEGHNRNDGSVNLGYLGFISLIILLLPAIAIVRKIRGSRKRSMYDLLVNESTEYEMEVRCGDIEPDEGGYYSSYQVGQAEPLDCQLDPNENYKMDVADKGYVFILNNNNFENGTIRKGSLIDVQNIENVFKQIGYSPIIKSNLRGMEIVQELHSLTRLVKKEHPSIVLVFMSHGVLEGILGTDGEVVSVESIKKIFSANNCGALDGKPKIMFFQACRGKSLTPSVDKPGKVLCEQSSSQDIAGDAPSASGYDAKIGLEKNNPTHTLKDRSSPELDGPVSDNADIYIAHATSEGYFSLRDRVNGSWFIQALCEQLFTSAHNHDLDKIMTKVTKRVRQKFAQIPINGTLKPVVQTPQTIRQGIEKTIYFLPKYPTTNPAGQVIDS